MKPLRGITTLKEFEEAEEKPLKTKGRNIVTELLDVLGEKPVGSFELSWREYAGLQRHIKRAEDERKPALLKAKVLDYEGSGQKRTYRVAIAKATKRDYRDALVKAKTQWKALREGERIPTSPGKGKVFTQDPLKDVRTQDPLKELR